MRSFFKKMIPLFLLLTTGLPSLHAAPVTVNKTCMAVLNKGGSLPPVLWGPWLPNLYVGFRFKVGVLASLGTVNVRVPFLVAVTYDPDAAVPGNWMPVEVQLVQINQYDQYNASRQRQEKNFVADFGVSFPDKVQVGFGAGLSYIGNVGTWYDLPGGVGFWDILKQIPEIPAPITAANEVLSVNVNEKVTPPLNGTELSFVDSMELINTSLSDWVTGDALETNTHLGKLVNWVYAKVSSLKPSFISEATAKKLIGKGLGQAMGAVSFVVTGQPEYKWKGRSVDCVFFAQIPGLGSGEEHRVSFTGTYAPQTFKVFIPWNAKTTDKLSVKMTRASYDTMVTQKLKLDFQLTFLNWNPTLGDAVLMNGDVPDPSITEAAPWIPINDIAIRPAATSFGGVTAVAGAQSVRVVWYTPLFATKGKIEIYKDSTKIGEAQETGDYVNDHSLYVGSLTAKTTYTAKLYGTDENGVQYTHSAPVTFTTKTTPRVRTDFTNDFLGYNLRVESVTRDSAVIKWETDNNTTTDVQYGPSTDYGETGKWVFNGTEANKTHETAHSMLLTNLAPGTKYYYSAMSWVIQPNQTSVHWEKANQTFTTLPPPPPPSAFVYVQYVATGAPGVKIPVTFEENGQAKVTLQTGTAGVTPVTVLDYGKSYVFKAEVPAHHIQGNSFPSLNVPQASLVNDSNRSQYVRKQITLKLEKDASPGGFVWDARSGAAVAGADIAVTPGNLGETTDANGHFVLEGLNEGSYQFTATKTGYLDLTGNATVDEYGLFRAGVSYMKPKTPRVIINVRKPSSNTGLTGFACPVTIKKGQTVISASGLVTDSAGKLVWDYAAGFGVDTPQTLTITATPPSGQNIGEVTQDIQAQNAETVETVLTCPMIDTAPPVLSNIVITRTGLYNCNVRFTTDEIAKTISAKILANGQTAGQAAETDMSYDHNFALSANYVSVQAPGAPVSFDQFNAGTIELKVEDSFSNQKTETYPVPVGTTPPSGSRVYVDKMGDLDWAEATSARTGETLRISASGMDSDGRVVSQAWEMTGEQPATYNHTWHTELRIPSQPGNLHIKVTFVDNAGLSYAVEKDVTVTEAPPVVRLASLPSIFTRPGDPLNVGVEANSFTGLSEVVVDWGDRQKDTITGSGAKAKAEILSHAYATGGTYTVSAAAKSVNNVHSQVATASVTIANPPSCVLSIAEPPPYPAGQIVTLNMTARGAPGFKWELKQGAKTLESGTETGGELGDKGRQVPLKEGTEIFTLKITDGSGNVAVSTAVARVGIDLQLAMETARPSLALTPKSANAGEEVTLKLVMPAASLIAKEEAMRLNFREGAQEQVGLENKTGPEEKGAAAAEGEQSPEKEETVLVSKSGAKTRVTAKKIAATTKKSSLSAKQKALMKETGLSEKGGGSSAPYRRIMLDWGDGVQELLALDSGVEWKHSYAAGGHFAVQGALEEKQSGGWVTLRPVSAVIAELRPRILLESLEPALVIPGTPLGFKARSENINVKSWTVDVFKDAGTTPLEHKAYSVKKSTLEGELDTKGWAPGVYRLTLRVQSLIGEETPPFSFPFVVRDVSPALAIPSGGVAGELMNGLVTVLVRPGEFDGLKLAAEYGNGQKQEIEIGGEGSDPGADRILSRFTFGYEKPGTYTVTVLLKQNGKQIGEKATRSIVVVAPRKDDGTESREKIFEMKFEKGEGIGFVGGKLAGLKGTVKKNKGAGITASKTGASSTTLKDTMKDAVSDRVGE